jgi:hypothetical protein
MAPAWTRSKSMLTPDSSEGQPFIPGSPTCSHPSKVIGTPSEKSLTRRRRQTPRRHASCLPYLGAVNVGWHPNLGAVYGVARHAPDKVDGNAFGCVNEKRGTRSSPGALELCSMQHAAVVESARWSIAEKPTILVTSPTQLID